MLPMENRDLVKIDLNLLVALQALLEERSVSRAAERLYITQPAMSKTLSRLRTVFDDPLFTRSSHGMQPTPRAEALGERLSGILAEIGELVSPHRFDPADYRGEINLALSEYIGVALLPPLIRKLHAQAPLLGIRTITRVENQLDELSCGNLDFAIHIEQGHYDETFSVYAIDDSPPAVLLRADHPLTRGRITLERLNSYPIIRLYVPDLEQVELARTFAAFDQFRHPRQGSLETSHLLTALEVLRGTEYVMPGPAYMLRNRLATEGIVSLPLPEASDYSLRYMLVAHQRTANSPVHQWFLALLLETIAELREGA
jgi:DNA-binding transcriptional LysR family regulator